jgi:hypothetical protein
MLSKNEIVEFLNHHCSQQIKKFTFKNVKYKKGIKNLTN